ncbi:MAG TPA: sugar nucleotide-binding protein, partial [Solirubrobacterales bacterium]|nr:sugar nucleotide-binding protein [Solirubrobacterales bacterium]
SWYDFAKEIFKLSEMEVTTLSATTEMFAAKAPRPAWSVLESGIEHAITLPDWQDGLAAYLEQRRSLEGTGS